MSYYYGFHAARKVHYFIVNYSNIAWYYIDYRQVFNISRTLEDN